VTPIAPKTAAGVLLASVSGILLTGELVAIQNEIIPVPREYLDMMRSLFTISSEMSITSAVLAFAFTPSICEEIMFRGILLRSFLGKIPMPWAIILTGFLFGLFHLDPYRILGTTVLGIIMGYITIRANSLLAPMIYHLANNLVILLVMNVDSLNQVPWLTEEAHLPGPVLFLSAAAFLAGVRLIQTKTDQKLSTHLDYELNRNNSVDES
jgi:membrane protease YdiL (CAAX protease family)